MSTRAALSLVLVLVLGCAGDRGARAEPAPPHSARPDGTVTLTGASRDYIRVEAAQAAPTIARRPLLARVALDEQRTASVGSPVSGRVASVAVVVGSIVAAGAPLLSIHSRDLADARASLSEARDARKLAQENADRAVHLVEQGAGSVAERQQALTALEVARSEEHRAEQALRAIGADRAGADFVLRAPIAGTVVERTVQVGNAVAAAEGPPLVTISDLGTVWILADVYEQDLAVVAEGDVAHVVVPAIGRSFDGRIDHIGALVDPATRAAHARIELASPDGALHPGMFATVEVESRERASALVPTSAVLARRDEFFVFVQTREDEFRARAVHLGLERAGQVSIIDGLQPGEPVVTRGAILLDAEANAAY